MVWAYSRGFAAVPLYSLANTDWRVRTLNSRTCTRTVSPVRWTVPKNTASAPSSRHDANGTCSGERAAGTLE